MKKYYILGIIAVIGTTLFYFIFFALINKLPISNDTNVWGAFGSYFGGVAGPILSFLAFIILAKTLLIQQDMFESQEKEHEKHRLLTELELCFSTLDKLEKQFDLLIGIPTSNLDGKTIKEVLETDHGVIDKNNQSVISAAESAITLISNISYFGADIEKRLNTYYSDDSGFSGLSYKQALILKYRPMAKTCIHILKDDYLTKKQKQDLLDGISI